MWAVLRCRHVEEMVRLPFAVVGSLGGYVPSFTVHITIVHKRTRVQECKVVELHSSLALKLMMWLEPGEEKLQTERKKQRKSLSRKHNRELQYRALKNLIAHDL